MPLNRPIALLWTGMLLGLAGCGGASRPPLGYVSGTVSMDGIPAENIIVAMKPEVGRTAMAKTDSKGFYDIEYTDGEKGTKVGKSTVHLEWPTGFAGPFSIPKTHAAGTSTLVLDVVKGKQTFDIKLETEGGKGGKKPAAVD